MYTMADRETSGSKNDLHRLLRPIFIVRYLRGLSSYEDLRSGRRNWPKILFGFLQVSVILVFLIRMAYKLHYLDQTVHQINNITVLYVSNMIQLIIIAMYPTLFCVADLYFSRLLSQIFSQLETLEVHHHKSRHHVRNIIIFYVSDIFICHIFRFYFFGRVPEFVLMITFVILAYTYVFFTYAHYVSILGIVKNELRAINQTIKTYLKQEQYHLVSKEDIYRLDKKYNTLYNITLQLNENYSILLVVTFLMDIMGISTGLFKVSQNFIESYISSSTPRITPLFLHELEWTMHHLCFTLWVIDACVSTQQKAYKSTLLAHKLHLHNTNADLTAATGTFRRHLKLQEMKFTGCDMFDLNYETMLTILSTMGTYCIILIQFQIQTASDQ